LSQQDLTELVLCHYNLQQQVNKAYNKDFLYQK
jgi:hypothetical protein